MFEIERRGRFKLYKDRPYKDFLFLNYSWVYGSTTYFNYFAEKGHTCDIANESNYLQYLNNGCVYKNIVVYLHEIEQLKHISAYVDKNPGSYLIQHDDTYCEQIQTWTNRIPDLFMRREQTSNTIVPTNTHVYPFHFPMNSIYDPHVEKVYDVCFVGTMTSARRARFVDKLKELSTGELSHLKWYIDVSDYPAWIPGIESEGFRSAVNKSKIGLHYFGNSYDSTRIWETLSCNTALLMPKYKIQIDSQPLDNSAYEIMEDDFSDLKEKIEFLLLNDRWKTVAENGRIAYNKYHTKQKCCEYYYAKVMKHCKL